MRKYLSKKIEIESAFKAKADELAERFAGEREESQKYKDSLRIQRERAAEERYLEELNRVRSHAIAREEAMFEEARKELTAVLTKSPSSGQVGYLQALSLLPGPTTDDLAKAAEAARGNAIAEQVVKGLCVKHGAIFASLEDSIDLTSTVEGLEEFERKRIAAIMRYGGIENVGSLGSWFGASFIPEGTCKAFDKLDEAIARYA